ncbi:MAG: hypothetical protein RIQ31_98 [Actinomycetota bacterium]|jgi:hypothetical protein
MVIHARSRLSEASSARRDLEVHLVGGLGNQLFTYVAGLRFAEMSNRQVRVNVSLLERGEYSHQNSSIQDLLDPSIVGSRGYWRSRFLLFFRKRLNSLRPALLTDSVQNPQTMLASAKTVHLFGYFQDMGHVEPRFTGELSAQLRIRSGSAWMSAMRTEATLSQPICIHIRRGDYLNLRDTYGILGSEYFRQGIQRLRASGQSGPLWIFTDSPRELEADPNFHFEDGQILINEPPETSALDVLTVMKACSSFIISNSTFSYWAAMFSDSNLVVAPRIWSYSQAFEGPRFPQNWLLEDPNWL